jgi:hypothetical protein
MKGIREASWVVAAVGLSLGCGLPDGIDAYLRGLALLPSDPPGETAGAVSAPVAEGDYSCTTQDFTETRRFDEIVAFAANSDSLFPGALLRGDSVYSGLFTQAVFDRKPLTFSVSLESIAGTNAATMERPSLSEFRDDLGEILSAELAGATPANIFSEIEEVHSEEQLALAMGADVSWGGLIRHDELREAAYNPRPGGGEGDHD